MKKKTNLSGRRSELEERFFFERDQQLLQALRQEVATKEKKRALAEAAGITDEGLLGQLVEMEVSHETVVALSLVPLIAVAWADGSVDTKERQAVIEAAQQSGMEKGHAAYQLLEQWLQQEPDARLLNVWKGYVAALSTMLAPEAQESLKHDLLGRARAVAEAAGGLLGLGNRVSKSEQAVLNELEQAFQPGRDA